MRLLDHSFHAVTFKKSTYNNKLRIRRPQMMSELKLRGRRIRPGINTSESHDPINQDRVIQIIKREDTDYISNNVLRLLEERC